MQSVGPKFESNRKTLGEQILGSLQYEALVSLYVDPDEGRFRRSLSRYQGIQGHRFYCYCLSLRLKVSPIVCDHPYAVVPEIVIAEFHHQFRSVPGADGNLVQHQLLVDVIDQRIGTTETEVVGSGFESNNLGDITAFQKRDGNVAQVYPHVNK